jgi:uncharacterized protein
MTVFDLRSVRLRSGDEHRLEKEIELGPFVLAGQRYDPVPEPLRAELAISQASTGTVLELSFPVRLHGPCQRCLADAVLERDLHVREYHASSPGGVEELTTPYVVDDRLDLTQWARDALALSLPEQLLCRPDCAGLCPVCGKDLNREPHVHEEADIDPRWAVLAELKDQL